MESRLKLEIHNQPTLSTCGPTCLHAVYRYFGSTIPLEQVISEIQYLDDGGTLAVMLACHALRNGFSPTIYTYNLQVFDPTWFRSRDSDLAGLLRAQAQVKEQRKLRLATKVYLEFLELGGRVKMEDLTSGLIRKYLKRGVPILTGLSATYLYNEPRELNDSIPDDVRGWPQGHFVVLSGYDSKERTVEIADPFQNNPISWGENNYVIDLERVMCSIMLGILTYDANLLVIQPSQHN
jgi:hypothetical protein